MAPVVPVVEPAGDLEAPGRLAELVVGALLAAGRGVGHGLREAFEVGDVAGRVYAVAWGPFQ